MFVKRYVYVPILVSTFYVCYRVCLCISVGLFIFMSVIRYVYVPMYFIRFVYFHISVTIYVYAYLNCEVVMYLCLLPGCRVSTMFVTRYTLYLYISQLLCISDSLCIYIYACYLVRQNICIYFTRYIFV